MWCDTFCGLPIRNYEIYLRRAALFWVFTQCVVVNFYLSPWRWDRWAVPKRRWGFTITRCLTTQKSAYLIYIAAEAWNYAWNILSELHPSLKTGTVSYVNMDSPSLVENRCALTVWVPTRWNMKHFVVRMKYVEVWKFPSKLLVKQSAIVELASERYCLKRTRHPPLSAVCNFPCGKKLRVIYTKR